METVNSRTLRDLMIERNIGVLQLANMAGLTATSVSKILSQKNPLCRLPTIGRIAKALNVDAQSLLAE